MWRYVLWPWGTVLVSLLVSLCGCGEEPRPPIVLEDCKQNTSFLPGSKLELQVNPRTEYYCLPTNLTEQSVEDRTFRLVANNGFLLDISAFDNDERSSEITLSYTVVEGRVDPTSLNRSCYRQDRIVEIRTDNVDFSALVNMSIIVGVGGVDSVIRYFTPGLHLPSSDTFTLEDIKNRATALLSVVVLIDERPLAPIFDYKVCEVPGGSTGLIQSPNFSVGRKMSDEIHVCTTLTTLQDKDLFIELSFNNPGDVVPGEYKVVVRARECDALITSPEITIIVPPSPTETPTESPSVSSTPTPTVKKPRGLSDGDIVGIVFGVMLLIAILVIVAAVVIVKFKRRIFHYIFGPRRKDPSPQPSPGDVETQEAVDSPPPVDTQDATVYVCNLSVFDCVKISKCLAQHDNAALDISLLENIDTDLSSYRRLDATVKKTHCLRLYIMYQESMEWLRENHHEVWEFVRDFQNRPLTANLLDKVVLIRVYSHKEKTHEFVDGPLPTMNFRIEKWQNEPDECVSMIQSKLRMARHTRISIEATHTATVPHEDTGFQHSSSSTPPLNQPNPITATPPPGYRETPVLQQIPTNIGADPEIKGMLKVLVKYSQQTANHTDRLADRVEGMNQTMDETLAVTRDTNTKVHENNIREEAPPNI
jgi:hypothetical protein